MSLLRNKLIALVFLFLSNSGIAQNGNIALELNFQVGKLWRHSPKMNFYPSGESLFYGINLSFQTSGDQFWHHYYNGPKYGISFQYLQLGKPTEILKDGFGLYPFLDLPIGKIKNAEFHLFLACGLAYLNGIYDLHDRSDQTAIGSHLNNLTTIQSRMKFPLNKKHFYFIGLALNHFSNGAFKTPNLGLNFISVVGGIELNTSKYSSQLRYESNKIQMPEPKSRWSYGLEYGLALKETLIPGGPKFLIQTCALALGFHYSYFKAFGASIEYENNALSSFLEVYSTREASKKSGNGAANKLFFYGSHLWEIGLVRVAGRIGCSLYNKDMSTSKFPLLTKLDIGFRIPILKHWPVESYLGFSLKTRLFTAEYISAVVGIRMRKQKTKD